MAVLKQIPTEQEMESLIGAEAFSTWKTICAKIDKLYDMEHMWNDGGKRWKYEYKYRRGGKTLCALYARQNCFGCMIIFGEKERERVECLRNVLSPQPMGIFDSAITYHDGKWVMFDETTPLDDIVRLLAIKRRPNKG